MSLATIYSSYNQPLSNTTFRGWFNITSDGGESITQRGMCWSTSPNPTTANSKVTVGGTTGVFQPTSSAVSNKTWYYVRGYAINASGTAYSPQSGVYVNVPTATTNSITNITQTNATGNVTFSNVSFSPAATWHNETYMFEGTQQYTYQQAAGNGSYSHDLNQLGNLTPNTTYNVRAGLTIDMIVGGVRSISSFYSNTVGFTTSPTIPTVSTTTISNISQTTATGGGNVTTTGGASVTAKGVCWSTSANPTIANSHTHDGTGTGSFTSILTSLSSNNTTYYYRAYATNSVGTAYGSEKSFLIFLAPTDLNAASVGAKEVCLQWVNNSYNDDLTVWYKKENQAWVLYDTISSGDTSICVTGLSMGTQYTFAILNNYNASTLSSNQLVITTDVTFLIPFCSSDTTYNITGSTCGNASGRIELSNEDYTIFYNFTLHDIDGNEYVLTDYYWTGLTSGYYFITATVKLQWYYHYGNDSCGVNWVEIIDTDTSIGLISLILKPAICGGFGEQAGRILIQVSGVTAVTFTAWNQRRQLVTTQHITGSTSLINAYVEVSPDVYYVQLESGVCKYLTGLVKINKADLYTVEGIQRLFLTPWSSTLTYNYYSSSDEDWYVTGIDTQQFTSTKIKEYDNLDDFWYEIKLDTAVMNYSQSLQKGSYGLTYNEQVNISIPHADNAKWKELTTILSQRYVLVFQDNNDNYWTCGYRDGMEIKSYQLSDNQYVISFIHPSVRHMLTSMDADYVKLHIL